MFVVQDGHLAYVNQKFADIFGYSQAALIGSSPAKFAAAREQTRIREILTSCSGSGTDTFQAEITGERRDGTEVAVEVHGGSVEYNGDEAMLGILRDVSGEE